MSNSQGRERKRPRDDFGPLGTNNVGARQDFPFRERLDSLTQKRSRSSWGGRTEWDNEHGQIPDRQISERERDLRDAGWDKGLNIRGRGNGRDDSYFGSGRTSSGVSSSGLNGRDRGSDDNDHRWPSASSRDGPFPSDGLYRSHSASEYENDRGGNTGDRWHGGYRDGFERDRIRRERDERDSMGPGLGSGSQCRRPSPLYFEQSRGSSRERDKIREYSGRYQRSQSPHYSDSPPMRRLGSSSGDYSNTNFSKNYWSRSGGPDNSSSSSNKIRSLSPTDYHPDERDKIRIDSACRGSRSDSGRNSFGYDEFRGGGGGGGGTSTFDGYRRAISPRDDNTGVGVGSGSGFGGGSSGSVGGHAHLSRDRHPPYVDNIDTERVGEARSRGSWPSPQGLNRGGFFGGRGGINRFGGHSIEGGGRGGHSGFGIRNFSFQRRVAEEMRRPLGDGKSSTSTNNSSSSSNNDKAPQGASSSGSSSNGDVALNGNGPGMTQPGDQEEGSDNMEIDTDTVEVMATPVRRQRIISDPDVRQFLLLREALMDYDLAKALCTIGVKPPAAAVTVQSQSQSLPSSEEKRTQNDSVNESASKSQSEQIELPDVRSNMRQSTPTSSANASSSSSGSRTKDLGSQDSGVKSIRGAEGPTGREVPVPRTSTSTSNLDMASAGSASRQPGQGRAPDRGSVVIASGIGRTAPLPPYPRGGSGTRTQPQPPSTSPPYNQQQYGQGQGQGHDYHYPPPSQQRIYLQNQNQPHSYSDCYNYNRNNVGPRGSSDHLNQPTLNAQSHHIEEGRPRPPHGPPKGPGRGPQPPLPPVPAPPTR